MKYRSLFLQAAAVSICILTYSGCTEKNIDTVNTKGSENPVEINAGISLAANEDQTDPSGPIEDDYLENNELPLYFMRSDNVTSFGSGYMVVYDVSLFCEGTREEGAGEKEMPISFSPRQFYPMDGTNTLMRAYFPEATPTTTNLTWSFDGDDDIMVSNYLVGNSSDKGIEKGNFALEHLLTQLQFYVYAATTDIANQWGKVTSIKINNTNNQLVFTPMMNDMGMADIASPQCCIFSGSSPFNAYGISSDGVIVPQGTVDNSGDDVSVTGAAEAGGIMIAPVTSSSTISLEITTETSSGTETVSTVEIPSATYQAGYAKRVYLEFQPREIEIKLTPAEWEIVTVDYELGTRQPQVIVGTNIIAVRDMFGDPADWPVREDATEDPTPLDDDGKVPAALQIYESDSNQSNWNEARSICPEGWRIPTLTELKLIQKYNSKLLNPLNGTERYWSGSAVSAGEGEIAKAYYMTMNSATEQTADVNQTLNVRCVRDYQN